MNTNNNIMTESEARKLLEQWYAGTLDTVDEARLIDWFCISKDIPVDLQPDAAIFRAMVRKEVDADYRAVDFAGVLDRTVRKHKRIGWAKVIGIAVAAVIVLALVLHIGRNQTVNVDQSGAVMIAEADTMSTLKLVIPPSVSEHELIAQDEDIVVADTLTVEEAAAILKNVLAKLDKGFSQGNNSIKKMDAGMETIHDAMSKAFIVE